MESNDHAVLMQRARRPRFFQAFNVRASLNPSSSIERALADQGAISKGARNLKRREAEVGAQWILGSLRREVIKLPSKK